MLRRVKKAAPQGVVGRARVGKRTKDLIKTLEPGDIAVIDHADLDRVAADGLIGSSIGFQRIAGGKPTADEVKRYTRGGREPNMVAREWEWIELSITAMPANVDAQARGFEDAKAAMLDELVSKGRVDRALGVALGLPESRKRVVYPTTEPKRLVVVLDK